MEECVDGEYQDFKSKNGAYIRENFFGRYPETAALVADWSDEKIWTLDAAAAMIPARSTPPTRPRPTHKGQPTVILAKTVKGYGMGEAGEGQMITHQEKKMGEDALKQFRDRFSLPISDEELKTFPFLRFPGGQRGDELSPRAACRRSAAICPRGAPKRPTRSSSRRSRPSRRS